jgi:DNA uptake protein ComE-like DNA-binding protein
VKKLLNIQPVYDWFGYTRRERRSTFILLIIVIIVILSRYTVPENNIEVVNAGPGYYDSLTFAEFGAEERTQEKTPSGFNPKTAANDTVIKMAPEKMGVKGRITSRSYGGRFSKVDYPPVVQAKSRLNLNTCDTTALIRLPGIGPVLSARIIKYRNLLGGFAKTEQLREVYGLPEETYELIRGRVYADSSEVRRIKINSSDSKQLGRIPYIEKYEVSAILKYRELSGRISSMEDMLENKILSPDKGKKVWAYIDFE